MGIERFFSSIKDNNITNLESSFTKILEYRIPGKRFYIDFNSIVYITSAKVVYELNYLFFKILTNKYQNNEKFEKLIREYGFDLSEQITYQQFLNLVKKEDVDAIIIEKILEYIESMLLNYVDPNKLELLFIGVDGVPSLSKMIEQRRRRYTGAIISEFEKKLFSEYESSLKEDHIRYEYETNKIRWNRNVITPGTKFMETLNNLLSGTSFQVSTKTICPNLKEYIFSGVYEPGEGEKKIVDHIRSSSFYDDIIIYSPDSDVTLLGLLLSTAVNNKSVENLKLIRHNQQSNNYNIIDIDMLSKNIYYYVRDKLQDSTGIDKDSIIRDIVFVLTVFGNDFLPKIESFNVKEDFNRIIDKYIELLNDNYTTKYNYIIQNDNELKKINYDQLLQIIKILHYDEGGNLQKMYMNNHYQNYQRLKKIISTKDEDFTKSLNIFLEKLRNLNDEIRKKRFDKNVWIESEQDFINKLSKLVVLDQKIDNDTIIDAYHAFYEKFKKFPLVRVTFKKYKKSLNDAIHRQKLESSVDYKITKYDEEMFKFNNMLDEYQKKINAYPLNLGYVSVNPVYYTWQAENIKQGVQRYYKQFFGQNEPGVDILDNYVEGLLFVFDYYFNHFDPAINREYASLYMYKKTHAPLLTQIYHFLKSKSQQYIDEKINVVRNNKMKMVEYFNCVEHLMFTSAVPLTVSIIPPEYNKFAKSSWYPNFKQIVDELWNNDVSQMIDCRGAIFLSKCHLNMETPNTEEVKKFLTDIRKIKVTPETKKLAGTVYDFRDNVVRAQFGKLTSLDKLKN